MIGWISLVKQWIRNQPNAGPYQTKKFVYYKSDKGSLQDNSSWTPGYTAINFPIIRFADVLLMAAECEIEIGSPSVARDYVNMIRQRAADSFLKRADGSNAAKYVISQYNDTWAKDQATRDKVRFERQLELHSEGHRFYDLVRWGTAATELNKFITYEAPKYGLGAMNGASFDAGVDELLPIPQSQLDLLNVTEQVVKQNPGY
ncbi:MAG: RagB/SusD family nutrient uptake outer membrane protein [Bacteroidota bacterium]